MKNVKLELVHAKTLGDIKSIRDKAAAVQRYVGARGDSLEEENNAAEMVLECERRAGALIKADPSIGTGKNTKLVSLGITANQSSRWQKESTVSDEDFQAYCTKQREAGEQITQYGLLSLARKNGTGPTTKPKPVKGRFPVIYADPPWKYGAATSTGAAADHYKTMTIKELCAMKVKSNAMKDAVLFMWVTNPLLADAFEVMKAWGFKYKTNVVWVKDKATTGLGFYLRGKHELLLIGTRGSFMPDSKSRPVSVVEAPREQHSKKPDKFYRLIEKMYPEGPYLELFARRQRKGWTGFGNQLSPV